GHPDAGRDAGRDAGLSVDDQCEFDSRPCATGVCMLMVLSDAGVAKRCITSGECDVVAQDCGTGRKCTYVDGGGRRALDGTPHEGEPCAGLPSTCKKGLVCTVVGDDGGSGCSRFCRLDADCTPPQWCYVTLSLDGTRELPLVCADPPTTCSPLIQNCP